MMALWRAAVSPKTIGRFSTTTRGRPRGRGHRLARALAREREALDARGRPVGVEIAAGADAQEHLAEVADRPLVALEFDKFGDGRAFSYAMLLRERHGFRGDLRAIGDVLIDEIPLMLRCGFTRSK